MFIPSIPLINGSAPKVMYKIIRYTYNNYNIPFNIFFCIQFKAIKSSY